MSKTINIQIGDWSGDGHGKCEDFHFKSNKSIKDVREAYFSAKDKYPHLCPEEFCEEYEDGEVPERIITGAKELGFEIDKDDFFLEEMARYVAWYCKLGDPFLELKLKKAPPTLSFYGYDKKKRHIRFFGYGLLGS